MHGPTVPTLFLLIALLCANVRGADSNLELVLHTFIRTIPLEVASQDHRDMSWVPDIYDERSSVDETVSLYGEMQVEVRLKNNGTSSPTLKSLHHGGLRIYISPGHQDNFRELRPFESSHDDPENVTIKPSEYHSIMFSLGYDSSTERPVFDALGEVTIRFTYHDKENRIDLEKEAHLEVINHPGEHDRQIAQMLGNDMELYRYFLAGSSPSTPTIKDYATRLVSIYKQSMGTVYEEKLHRATEELTKQSEYWKETCIRLETEGRPITDPKIVALADLNDNDMLLHEDSPYRGRDKDFVEVEKLITGYYENIDNRNINLCYRVLWEDVKSEIGDRKAINHKLWADARLRHGEGLTVKHSVTFSNFRKSGERISAAEYLQKGIPLVFTGIDVLVDVAVCRTYSDGRPDQNEYLCFTVGLGCGNNFITEIRRIDPPPVKPIKKVEPQKEPVVQEKDEAPDTR